MLLHDVFKTLYSPIKAFKEIVDKPDVKGPLIILVLILALTTVSQYSSASKIFDEEPMINRDEMTESTEWAPQWASNGKEIKRDIDSVFGNYSIASSVTNSTHIWMNLTKIGSFNCSRKSGYEQLAFSIKWESPSQMLMPPNATLTLFSDNTDDYFTLDFGSKLSNSSDEWSNVKVDVGPESENSEGWERLGSPNWKNVTGVEYAFVSSVPENLTMKIDDLYFAKFAPLTKNFFSRWSFSLMMSGTSFFINWFVYAIVLMLVIKVFGEKLDSGKTLFMVVGYLFSVRIIHILGAVALIQTLPETRLENLDQVWYTTVPYQAIGYLGLVTDVWMAALCTIALHFLYTLAWRRAVGISVLASVINSVLISFMAI